MSTTINSTTANTAANGVGSTSRVNVNSADAQQDRFLKLLVAQMNNQDPMNPFMLDRIVSWIGRWVARGTSVS